MASNITTMSFIVKQHATFKNVHSAHGVHDKQGALYLLVLVRHLHLETSLLHNVIVTRESGNFDSLWAIT